MASKMTTRLMLPIGVMILNKQMDYTQPETLKMVRGLFTVAMALMQLVFYVLRQRIKAKNEVGRTVRVPKTDGDGKVDVKTVLAYDLDALDGLTVQTMIAFGIGFALHHFMKINPPMLLQSFMQPLTLWESQLFQVHGLGRSDEAEALERPWKSHNILESATAAAAAWESMDKKRAERWRKLQNGMKSAKTKNKGAPKAAGAAVAAAGGKKRK